MEGRSSTETEWTTAALVGLLVATPLLVWVATRLPRMTWELMLFSLLITVADFFELRLPFGSYSVSSAPIFATVLLFDLPSVVTCVVIASIGEGIAHRKRWERIAFNIGQMSIAAALAWLAHRLASNATAQLLSISGLLAAAVGWAVFFVLNVGAVGLGVCQTTGKSWRDVWRGLIRPTLPVGPMEGIVGICLAVAYRAGGQATLVLFLGLYSMAYVALVSAARKAENEDLSTKYEDTQAYLRDLVAGMLNGVVAVDGEGRVTMLNPAAEGLLGRRTEDVLGLNVEDLGETTLPGLLRQALTTGQGVHPRELELHLPDRTLEVIGSVAVLRDAEGKPAAAVAVVQDVTEQKQIERRLGHLDRLALMGEFAAGVVHEINNPLALVTMALDGAKYSLTGGETGDVVHNLDLARRNVGRLEKLSRQLLSFSRPVPAALSKVDIGETVNEVLNIVAPQARIAGVQVIREVPGDLGLLADSSALQQIVLNLAANAIQAMPEGGELRVAAGRVVARFADVASGRAGSSREGVGHPLASCGCLEVPEGSAVRVLGPFNQIPGRDRRRGFVWLSFADSGIGISAEALQRLGQSFFTTKETGTGLGIAVVCKLLAQYRGAMEIVSAVGGGTTFRLWFPEMTKAEVASLASYEQPSYFGGELVAAEEGAGGLAEAAWETSAARYGATIGGGWLSRWTGVPSELPDPDDQ